MGAGEVLVGDVPDLVGAGEVLVRAVAKFVRLRRCWWGCGGVGEGWRGAGRGCDEVVGTGELLVGGVEVLVWAGVVLVKGCEDVGGSWRGVDC